MTQGGIRIGSVLGFPIRVDPSWLIIFALVTFSLTAYFHQLHKDLPLSSALTAAIAASLAFFASVLLHELSHSVVARRRGMRVHGITLFIFGGVSQLADEPKRPQDEFWMAVVGPLTSAALGGIFLAAAIGFPEETLLNTLFSWLGFINLALAVFNLLPGFPLDGGRVFRAIVWGATKDLRKATRVAGLAGMTVAYLLILLGIFMIFQFGNLIGGIWMAFIGWFLLTAARSAEAQADLREVLASIRVGDIARRDCAVVSGADTVRSVVQDRMLRGGERCILVSDDGRLRGIVTLHEIRPLSSERWDETTMDQIMVEIGRLAVVSPEDSAAEALAKMDEAGVNQLPVLDGETLFGLVTRENLLRLVTLHLQLGQRAR